MKKIAFGLLLIMIFAAACTNRNKIGLDDKPMPVEPDGGIGTTPSPTDGSGGAAGTVPAKRAAIECTPEQKAAEACTMEYMPVCGYFNQEVQCIKAPCAQTFGNACTACADEKVAYYTQGECPVDGEDIAK